MFSDAIAIFTHQPSEKDLWALWAFFRKKNRV